MASVQFEKKMLGIALMKRPRVSAKSGKLIGRSQAAAGRALYAVESDPFKDIRKLVINKVTAF
jgi:hypothetical protein